MPLDPHSGRSSAARTVHSLYALREIAKRQDMNAPALGARRLADRFAELA